jgi:hypothetical protein
VNSHRRAARRDEDKLITELRGRLSQLPSVKSTHFVRRDSALSVWVGIRDHDRSARYALYELEDGIPRRFPNMKVDFHVVPISLGSSLEAFIATARPGVRSSAQESTDDLHIYVLRGCWRGGPPAKSGKPIKNVIVASAKT